MARLPQPACVPAMMALLHQLDARFPNRSKASDGWIGDAAHRARKSWHNPDKNNWVHARDLTDDDRVGCDMARLTDELESDTRVMEMIHNGRYWHRDDTRGKWIKYTGSNGHYVHAHVVTFPGARSMDASAFRVPLLGGSAAAVAKTVDPGKFSVMSLQLGSFGPAVAELQRLLAAKFSGYAGDLKDDGIYGPTTEGVVRDFQGRWNRSGGTPQLTVDGVVGPATRRALAA